MADEPGHASATGPASSLPPELQAAGASPDDRTAAAAAHILGPLFSFVGPLVFYFVKRNSGSRFVMFHIRQAIWYQVVLLGALAVLIVPLVPLLPMVVAEGRGGGEPKTAIVGCALVLADLAVFLVLGVAAIAYAIYGAVRVGSGKDFEYAWIGRWLR
jgi:uncharacterized Tic20 family protein